MSETSDRISYSEDVKINIGDYESRSVHISYSTDVRDDESVKAAIARAKGRVRKSLYHYEKRIRLSSAEFVDFNTKEKLNKET